MHAVIGWDIGGVNTKAALVHGGCVVAVQGRAFAFQHGARGVVAVLRELAASLRVGVVAPGAVIHAVTMTAELSQAFRSKREGVAFVLDAMEEVFPDDQILVYGVDGRFLTPPGARDEWLAVSASNWVATARVVARYHPDAVLVDTGTTTTDIIPIVGGAVVAEGWTDPDRLASGELVYTGALRTPAEALAPTVDVAGRTFGVAGEAFALAGDVHLWRGDLAPAGYTVPTPDGRPAHRLFAGERLRRVICGDPALVDDAGVSDIAASLAEAQVAQIAAGIGRVAGPRPQIRTAVVAGLGAFLGEAAARRLGLHVERLADQVGAAASEYAPAASVALLLCANEGQSDPAEVSTVRSLHTSPTSRADVVVKIGGSLLEHPSHLDAVVQAVVEAARHARILVVPGGGVLADAVRAIDQSFHLSNTAAHWMAVRAMDQMASVLDDRYPDLVVVEDVPQMVAAHAVGRVPVLAPYCWLRDADPLPHSWDVTSDSIAAWLAGALRARRVVLVKAPGATGVLVDPYFAAALTPGIESVVVTADDADTLGRALAFGP